jgi:tetratricopeptide (TPR) repeat protein
MVGRIISHFEIAEKIGEGGFGVVYKARDLRLGRLVALKFLSSHLVSSPDALERFLREARAISALNHPNIATIYEAGEEEGQPFLVLEYLPGGTLRSRIRELRSAGLRLPMQEVIQCGLEVAEGLGCAHRHGFVHRDVKPANIMCTEEHTVKITDFGLVKHLGGGELTRTGQLTGTVAYMSPEQAKGEDVDHRSDIFSLGVVLYEMVTGEAAFRGPHEAAILHAVIHDTVPSLRVFHPEVPADFQRIVEHATAKDPQRRYQRMDQLADDLRKVQEKVKPVGVDDSTVTIRPIPPPRRWWKAAAAYAAALLLAIAAAVAVWPARCTWTPSLFAACRIPDDKHLAVLQFETAGGESFDRPLFDGLRHLVAANLGQLQRFDESLCVHVIDPAEISAVSLALTGSLGRVGSTVRLKAKLLNSRTMLLLREVLLDVPEKSLPFLQDQLIVQLAGILGLEMSPEAREELAAGGTLSAEAFTSYLRGLGFMERGDVDAAISALGQAIQEDARYARAYAGLGEAYRRKYTVTKAAQWLAVAQEDCERAIELNYAQAPVYTTLGLIHSYKHEQGQAIEAYERSLASNPVSPDTRRYLATEYEAEGMGEKARATYREAVDLRPRCWLAYHRLGRYLWDQARYTEAGTYFRRSAELAPNSPRVYHNLGALYLSADLLDEAATWFEKALALKPLASTYSNLALTYLRLGCRSDAVKMAEKAAELDARNFQIWDTLGEACLARPELNGRAKEAFRHAAELAEQESKRKPNDAQLRALLGYYYASIDETRKALAAIAQARRMDSGNVPVLFRAAVVYEMSGDRDLAIRTLQEALKGGYSKKETCTLPQLRDLRNDSRFGQFISAGCGQPPAGGCVENRSPQ